MAAIPDPRISPIFYYFQEHASLITGRSVGRKIGVLQEILCKKLLSTSPSVRDCIVYEPRVRGHSSATHKVEFVLFQPLEVINVGMGMEAKTETVPGLSFRVLGIDQERARVQFAIRWGPNTRRCRGSAGALVRVCELTPSEPQPNVALKTVAIDAETVRISILALDSPVASIESKRVGAQRFSNTDTLGSGIQTIEKAKQASLVAIDFDLEYNKTILPLSQTGLARRYRSFVVLGNGVHWTEQDLAVMETYVDFTYLARDDSIMRYAEFIRELALQQKEPFFNFFMSYVQGMTKTAPDNFVVAASDFQLLRPRNGDTLLNSVESQIREYPITSG